SHSGLSPPGCMPCRAHEKNGPWTVRYVFFKVYFGGLVKNCGESLMKCNHSIVLYDKIHLLEKTARRKYVFESIH
ncbi:hypothetical protein, partial [Faecalibaculum rodentium]|uniref:hypothetical protein n=1 Tax=Faecalibaculum rodentium TaxID=1702221 RepID=UPI00272CACED